MGFETLLTAEQIERHVAAGHWTNRIITDDLDDAVARTPEKVAYVDSRRAITFSELHEQVHRCAAGLRELGIGPGDVVSFQLPNWIEFAVLHLACTRIGAVSNPLIPIYREREVGFMVGLAESKLIVVPHEFRGFSYPAMIDRLRGDWPALQRVLIVDAPTEHDSWEEFMTTPWEERHSAADLASLRPDPNDVALLIFTSGTTGEPKGVMHTHNTLAAMNAQLPSRMGLDSTTVVHMASTFAHLTGFLFGLRLPIQCGLTCIAQDVWDARRFLDLVAKYRINYTSGATPFLIDLLDNLPDDVSPFASLTHFACMGAPIPRVIVRQAAERLPQLAVLGGWGQTEDGLVTIGKPDDPHEKISTTDGSPWPGMQVRTIDAEGNPTAAGVEGRIQLRGPFVFVGYAKRLELTREHFDAEGWFDTGDLGMLDSDGYLRISGRTKDIIVRGGENIPVSYVENVLYEHDDVASAALVAVSDPRLQERACACLVLKPGAAAPTLADLQQYLESKGVARPYWPERIEVMDQFPTTPSGKIQKFQLREVVNQTR